MLRVFLVSPWIVAAEGSEFTALGRLLESIRVAGARLSVLTRTPEQANHSRAVALCAQSPHSEILFLDSLHAKLYLLDSNGLRAAMIGSPNFTPSGDLRHRELAVEIRSVRDSDPAGMLVEDLFLFAREVMTDRNAVFHKRFGATSHAPSIRQ